MGFPTERVKGQITELEQNKFLLDSNGDVAVRVITSPAGLKTAGRITEVTLDTVSWKALPTVPLIQRNGLAVQNGSGQEIKVGFDNAEAGYVGWIIGPGGEFFIDISDSIVLYAKAKNATPTITVMEVS